MRNQLTRIIITVCFVILATYFLWPTIQRTIKSAIIAVTKSAYATFHAPPWWPACPFFFLTIRIGASFPCSSIVFPFPYPAFTVLTAFSTSSNEGRTAANITLRANSTTTTGAFPLAYATMPAFMHS